MFQGGDIGLPNLITSDFVSLALRHLKFGEMMSLQIPLLIPMLPCNRLSPGFTVLKKTVFFRTLNYYFLLPLAHSSAVAVLAAVDAGLLMVFQADPAILVDIARLSVVVLTLYPWQDAASVVAVLLLLCTVAVLTVLQGVTNNLCHAGSLQEG